MAVPKHLIDAAVNAECLYKYPDATPCTDTWGKHPECAITAGFAAALSAELELAYWAWTIIANAHAGNWDEASPEWREAAIRWRDAFHTTLASDHKSCVE